MRKLAEMLGELKQCRITSVETVTYWGVPVGARSHASGNWEPLKNIKWCSVVKVSTGICHCVPQRVKKSSQRKKLIVWEVTILGNDTRPRPSSKAVKPQTCVSNSSLILQTRGLFVAQGHSSKNNWNMFVFEIGCCVCLRVIGVWQFISEEKN